MLTLCRYVSGLDLEDAMRELLKSQYEPDFNDRWWEAGKILLKCLLEVCLLNMNTFMIAAMHASLIWAAPKGLGLMHCCKTGKCWSIKCFLLFPNCCLNLMPSACCAEASAVKYIYYDRELQQCLTFVVAWPLSFEASWSIRSLAFRHVLPALLTHGPSRPCSNS